MLVLPRLKKGGGGSDTNNGLLANQTDISICYCQGEYLIVASAIYEPKGEEEKGCEWVDKIIDYVATITPTSSSLECPGVGWGGRANPFSHFAFFFCLLPLRFTSNPPFKLQTPPHHENLDSKLRGHPPPLDSYFQPKKSTSMFSSYVT